MYAKKLADKHMYTYIPADVSLLVAKHSEI